MPDDLLAITTDAAASHVYGAIAEMTFDDFRRLKKYAREQAEKYRGRLFSRFEPTEQAFADCIWPELENRTNKGTAASA